MKKLIVLLVIAVVLLFSGCNLITPECPEVCPEIPGCPDCVCPGSPDCSCPCCPDCNCDCPEVPECEECPNIVIIFTADPEILNCDKPGFSTLIWAVTGADTVVITKLGSVNAGGSEIETCNELVEGPNDYTLTATNSSGSSTATVTITKIKTPPIL